MLPLGNIIRKYCVSFHYYADDTQLYISSRPGETHQIEKLMECIVDIKNWMTSNFLLLNSEKTVVSIIGPKTLTCYNLENCLTLDGCSVNSSSSVRNLGVLFDIIFTLTATFLAFVKLHFFILKNVSKLRPMLSKSKEHNVQRERRKYFILSSQSLRLTGSKLDIKPVILLPSDDSCTPTMRRFKIKKIVSIL